MVVYMVATPPERMMAAHTGNPVTENKYRPFRLV